MEHAVYEQGRETFAAGSAYECNVMGVRTRRCTSRVTPEGQKVENISWKCSHIIINSTSDRQKTLYQFKRLMVCLAQVDNPYILVRGCVQITALNFNVQPGLHGPRALEGQHLGNALNTRIRNVKLEV